LVIVVSSVVGVGKKGELRVEKKEKARGRRLPGLFDLDDEAS
jgi:hypothetical protein